MGRTVTIAAAGLVLGLAAAPVLARAEEAKTPIRASMFLSITAPQMQSREAAYDETLRAGDPTPRSTDGEVLPDGSVRYGKTTLTVRNPCPPGTHYEPLPLPGRRARN